MRYKIEKLEDMTDVKEIMNGYISSSSYRFLKYMMYIIIAIIVSVIIWAAHAEKDIVINTFGTIDTKNHICTIYIENTAIGNIKENDEVQIEIVSLSKNDYGVINSTIKTINDDIVVDENSGKKYYIAQCDFEKNTLTDKNGDEAKIRNGMEAKVSIINNKTTYLEYILKK